MTQIAEAGNLSVRSFKKNYLVAREGKSGICIFQAIYDYTDPARPPDDKKLREIKPDLYWLTVGGQQILPKPGIVKHPPLPVNLIYS